DGMLLVVDEDQAHAKFVSIAAITRALGIAPGTARAGTGDVATPVVKVVLPTAETAPVESFGDAADDPVIWPHPTDPSRSLVIATDKKAGLYVHDMQGQVVQFLPDGKMNNVDLRDGFRLGGETVTLVAASDRTHRPIALYRLDAADGQLVDVADRP